MGRKKGKGKREKRKNGGANSYSRFLLGILAVGSVMGRMGDIGDMGVIDLHDWQS